MLKDVIEMHQNRPELIPPFAFAVFSAAGVAPLVISNPMNLIVAEYAGIGFNEYAARMIPIAVVGWVTTYAVLRIIFRSELQMVSAKSVLGNTPATLSRPAKQFLGIMVVALGCFPALSYAGCGSSLPQPRHWGRGCVRGTASYLPRG
jgi:Na+/H+ antiporter NhaD/arsenite permease-like protein